MSEAEFKRLTTEHHSPPVQVSRAWKLANALNGIAERICDPSVSPEEKAGLGRQIDRLWSDGRALESVCRFALLEAAMIAARRGGGVRDAQRLFAIDYPDEAARVGADLMGRLLKVWNRKGRPRRGDETGGKWELARDLVLSVTGVRVAPETLKRDWERYVKGREQDPLV